MPPARRTDDPRPSTAHHPGGGRTRVRPLYLILASAVLIGLVGGALIARALEAAPTLPRGASSATWPTAPETSPSTPPDDHPWPGTAPPPVAGTDNGTAPATSGGPSSQQAGGAFCAAARSSLVSLGSQGLSALKAVATQTGDAAPPARSLVQQALNDATRLRDAAPAALSDSVNVLVSAWSGLSSALERAGYDRTTIVVLAVKYLASPPVALAVDLLSRWTATNC